MKGEIHRLKRYNTIETPGINAQKYAPPTLKKVQKQFI